MALRVAAILILLKLWAGLSYQTAVLAPTVFSVQYLLHMQRYLLIVARGWMLLSVCWCAKHLHTGQPGGVYAAIAYRAQMDPLVCNNELPAG